MDRAGRDNLQRFRGSISIVQCKAIQLHDIKTLLDLIPLRRPGEGRGRHVEQDRMALGGWVYIVTDRPFGVLYTGVTANLSARLVAHRARSGSRFARRWSYTRLVYVERHDRIEDAILREKRIKGWHRLWKLRLIAEQNPNWDDLFEAINA